MAIFRVPFKFTGTVIIKVEADDKEDAINSAYEEVYISSYAGNGGMNKLIGVSETNHSIHADDEYEVIENDVEEI